jgi:hypothetical protein
VGDRVTTEVTPLERVGLYAERYRDAQIEASVRQLELARVLREARKAGATIQQLMDWTGYSRRTIFYMLKEQS